MQFYKILKFSQMSQYHREKFVKTPTGRLKIFEIYMYILGTYTATILKYVYLEIKMHEKYFM